MRMKRITIPKEISGMPILDAVSLYHDDSDLRQQLSSDLFREFGIVIEPMDQLTLPNNIPPQSDRI